MKNDNKGFSLIELIVVIAIMAILVGALAPQVTKYIEKSRIATDKQAIGALFTAIQTVEADPDITSGTLALGGANNDYNNAIAEILGGGAGAAIYNQGGTGLVKLQSNTYKNAPIGVNITSGTVSIYVDLVDTANKMNEKGFVVTASGTKQYGTGDAASTCTYKSSGTQPGGGGVNNN